MAKRKARETSPEQESASPPIPARWNLLVTRAVPNLTATQRTRSRLCRPPSSQDIVNVDFEFFDPKPDDFHGTKALMKTYLDDATWDINGFVDLFLAQTTVGSVVKTSEEESPIGIITALNLGRYQDCLCMKGVHQYLQSKSRGKPEAKKIEEFWTKSAKDVGLIVSERLINVPMELVSPLYEGLLHEISWATEDEPTPDLQNLFKFTHYLLMTKVFEELPKKSKIKEPNKKQSGETEKRRDLIFIKPEDETFLQLSSWSFRFPEKGEAAAAHETKNTRQLRLVMGIEAKQIPVFMSIVKGLVE